MANGEAESGSGGAVEKPSQLEIADKDSANPATNTGFQDDNIAGTLLGEVGYKWVAPLISAAVILGFFVMLGVLLHVDGTKLGDMKDVLFTLLGALGAAFTQVINYWMGSSKGSADKTDILAKSGMNG